MMNRSSFRAAAVLAGGLVLAGCQLHSVSHCAEDPDPYRRYDCMRDTIFGGEKRAIGGAVVSTLLNGAVSFGMSGSHSLTQLAHSIAENVVIPDGVVAGGVEGGVSSYLGDLNAKTGGVAARNQSFALGDIRADVHRIARLVRASREMTTADQAEIQRLATLPPGERASRLQRLTERQRERVNVVAALQQVKQIYQAVFQRLGVATAPEARDGLTRLDDLTRAALADAQTGEDTLQTVGVVPDLDGTYPSVPR